ATSTIRVGLGYSNNTETGADGFTVPGASSWTPIDIPLSYFTKNGYPLTGKRLSVYGMNQGNVSVYDAAGNLIAKSHMGKSKTVAMTILNAGVYMIRQGSWTTTAIVN